jgi:hypothetical protein
MFSSLEIGGNEHALNPDMVFSSNAIDARHGYQGVVGLGLKHSYSGSPALRRAKLSFVHEADFNLFGGRANAAHMFDKNVGHEFRH